MGLHRGYCAIVFALLLPAVAQAGDLQPDAFGATVLSLSSYAGARQIGSGNAVVVAHDGWLVSTAGVVEGADRVVLGGIPANVVAVDRALDLALLRIAGDPMPAIFASAEPGDGDAVAAVGHWGDGDPLVIARGTANGRNVGALQMHNALFGTGGFGSLLVNECGDAIGIDRSNPQDAKADAPHGTAVAAPASQIEDFVARAGLHLLRADKACVSAVTLARQQAEGALARAEEAEKRARQLQASVNVSEREKVAALAAARRLRAAADAAETRRAAAEDSAASSQRLAQKRREAAEAAMQSEARARKHALWGGIGAGVLVFVIAIVAVILTMRARKRRELAESDAAAARDEAVRSTVAPEGAHDLLLEGEAPGGEKFAIKIPALALADYHGGAVLGRNPDEAAFVVNHAKVSRRHCRLFVSDRELFLEDLHSTNGTVLNGTPIGDPVKVYEGDDIAIGDVVLRLTFRDPSRADDRWETGV